MEFLSSYFIYGSIIDADAVISIRFQVAADL